MLNLDYRAGLSDILEADAKLVANMARETFDEYVNFRFRSFYYYYYYFFGGISSLVTENFKFCFAEMVHCW